MKLLRVLGKGLDSGSHKEATMAPSPIPPADISDDDPSSPTSYFMLEARRQNRETLGGEAMPKLPKSSPWGAGPQPGTEPAVDRRDDGDVYRPEDFFEPTIEPTTEGDE
jgi:hypothetical protein